tara:strand:+ start:1531 stop:2190 length:660 start_codon:yes stop_codon:yes gene_type:complete
MKNVLTKLRKTFLGLYREEQLSEYFYMLIKSHHKNKNIKILDYGSGFNPDLIFILSRKLEQEGFVIDITCADFYKQQEIVELNKKFSNVTFINIHDLPKDMSYDFSILSDVLHHVGVNLKETEDLLMFLIKVSKYVILKDHFEYSILSRQILRFMDFIGNYKDGVNIPKVYFSKEKYEKILEKLKIQKIDYIQGIKLYGTFFIPFNFSKYQFINLLSRN